MTPFRSALSLALLAILAAPAAHAEIAIDSIADSEVSFEGLIQADGNWFSNDVLDLNNTSGNDGRDSEFAARIGGDINVYISLVVYILAIGLSFVNSWISLALFLAVAMIWFIPDRRFER